MKLLFGLLLAATAAPVAQNGPWQFHTRKDPITDQTVSTMSVSSADGKSRFVIRCDSAVEKVVSIQYLTPRFLGSSARPVQIRFDQATPVTMEWEVSNKGVYERDGSEVAGLAKLIGISKRVFVRAFNFEDQPVDAAFEIAEARPLLQKVFTDCGYKDPFATAS